MTPKRLVSFIFIAAAAVVLYAGLRDLVAHDPALTLATSAWIFAVAFWAVL